GLSMGGFGTWAVALAAPDRFAAMAPICGGGDPARVGALRHLPGWAFHGARDPIVPLQRSVRAPEAGGPCRSPPRTAWPGPAGARGAHRGADTACACSRTPAPWAA